VQSFFSLSWILTWFSHNLDRLGDVARVFDFFLSSHPLMPVYATVALITQLREGLIQLQEQAVQEARNRWKEERRAKLDAQAAQNAFAAAAAISETGHSIPAAASPPSTFAAAVAAAAEESFDASSVTVEMSAVHLYFQNLPPLLDLDALFRRCQHLSADTPPAALIALVPELARAIPPDSPLLLLDGKGLDELPTKLTNYLDWKRMQKRNVSEQQQQQQQLQQHSGSTKGESSTNGHATASSGRNHTNNVRSSMEEDDIDDSRKYVSVAAPPVSSTAAASSAAATAAAAAAASSSKKSANSVVLATPHTFRNRAGAKAAAAVDSSSSSSRAAPPRGATGVVGALVSSCASLGSSGPVSVFAYPSVRAPLAHLVRFVLHARAKQLARNILAKGRAVSTKLRSRIRGGGGGGSATRNNQRRGFAAGGNNKGSGGDGGHGRRGTGRMPLLVALALLVAVVAILLGAYRVEVLERLPSVDRWLSTILKPATTDSG
jgi:hypothetical protein